MKLNVDHAFQEGVRAHTEGKLQEAENLYKEVISSQPGHVDANHNLGVLVASLGRFDEAIAFLRTALKFNQDINQFWLSYIDVLIRANEIDIAKVALEEAREKGISKEKLDVLEASLDSTEVPERVHGSGPPEVRLKSLIELYQKGMLEQSEQLAITLTEQYSEHPFAWKVLGAILKSKGRNSDSLAPMERATQLEPSDPEAHNNLGSTLQSLGRLEEAEKSYKRAVIINPDYSEAHYNLGTLLYALGRSEQAIISYQKALVLAPDSANAHMHLGIALQDLDRLQDAEASYIRAITLRPDYAECHYNLGTAYKESGRLDKAEESYRNAIAIRFEFPEAHGNLGNILSEQEKYEEAEASYKQAIEQKKDLPEIYGSLGNLFQLLNRLDEAEESYRQAIALQPALAEAHSNLGNTLRLLGRLDEAEASCRRAIQLKPDYAEAYMNLSNALQKLGRLNEAEKSDRKAIELKPDYAEAYFNLGITLQELGRLEEAEESYKKAIELKPNYAEAFSNLGDVVTDLNRVEDAEKAFRKAILLNPEDPKTHYNLGITLVQLARFEEAEESYNRAIDLDPNYIAAHSNRLMLISSSRFEPEHYIDNVISYSKIVTKQTSAFQSHSFNSSTTPLRVGFVSGDFSQHPVGIFLEGLLAELHLASFELFAYSTNYPSGPTTERLHALFHSWIPIGEMTDEEAARRIHSDQVDVLIDLSGHTRGNRLSVFGWRPAPVQISWLGYWASTGIKEIDYILGDPFVTPKEDSSHFIEKIWQLPESYLCFTPPPISVPVGNLPAMSKGFVTFGCFNRLNKISEEVIAVRAAILHAVPNSKLFLKDKQLESSEGITRTLSRYSTYGISKDRLLFEGRSSREEYLSSYNDVDIALSPFPYGGGTTTVEGLWMGVPAISRKGNYFLSRIGDSISQNSGLSNWVAADNDDYIMKAVEFSSDLKSLEVLRRSLRPNLEKTALFDIQRFALHFKQALRQMCQQIK